MMRKEYEKAPVAEATTTEAWENALQGSNTAPAPDCNIRAGAGQDITDYIPLGAQNAVTAEVLSKMTGLTPRAVTRAIQAARRRGAAICASTGDVPGYYLTDDPGEVECFLQSLAHRGREIEATREALSITRDKLAGQGRMEGF